MGLDRKSTRLNSSHLVISYAVFCLKKKNATDNHTVGMGDAGTHSAILRSHVPHLDEAVPRFVSGAMAKAGKGLLEGTLQAGTSALSDKLRDWVGRGGKSAAEKGKDTRDDLAAAFPFFNNWERAADVSSFPRLVAPRF